MDRRRAVVALAVFALVVLGALAAVLLLRGGGEDDRGLAAFSTRGKPVEMEIPEQLGPWGDVTGEAVLIAERRDVRFLRLPRKDGSSCWATAESRSGFWSLTGFACEGDFLRFPDPKRPVMVVGRQQGNPVTRLFSYERFEGFAADGVRRVGVIDADDRVVEVAAVTNNVFSTPSPPEAFKRLVALDEAGEIIWRGAEVPLPTE